MMNFDREVLKLVQADVRKAFPDIRVNRDAWVYHLDRRDHWEFHGPDSFYWHGSAGSAWDARAKGWAAYLEHKGIETGKD